MAAMERIDYDEFGLFHENASEYGLPCDGPPTVRRSLVSSWRTRAHAQRARVGRRRRPSSSSSTAARRTPTPGTPWPSRWARPLVAVDLPGHGHSVVAGRRRLLAARTSPTTSPWRSSSSRPGRPRCRRHVARRPHVDRAGRARPELVRGSCSSTSRRASTRRRPRPIIDFVDGPAELPRASTRCSQRTMEHNPTRTRVVAAPGHPPQRPPASTTARGRGTTTGVTACRRPPRALRRGPRSDRLDNGRLWDAVRGGPGTAPPRPGRPVAGRRRRRRRRGPSVASRPPRW